MTLLKLKEERERKGGDYRGDRKRRGDKGKDKAKKEAEIPFHLQPGRESGKKAKNPAKKERNPVKREYPGQDRTG